MPLPRALNAHNTGGGPVNETKYTSNKRAVKYASRLPGGQADGQPPKASPQPPSRTLHATASNIIREATNVMESQDGLAERRLHQRVVQPDAGYSTGNSQLQVWSRFASHAHQSTISALRHQQTSCFVPVMFQTPYPGILPLKPPPFAPFGAVAPFVL